MRIALSVIFSILIISLFVCMAFSMRSKKPVGKAVAFLIAGSGPQEEIVKRIATENSHVIYLGILKPEELAPVYRYSDIGLCTYADYSTVDMPDKFYDYTAAGLGIVNSLQGEVKDYVKNTGGQYEAENSESLYAAIKKTITRLKEYKDASYKLANRFDLHEQMKPLLQMVNNLIGNM